MKYTWRRVTLTVYEGMRNVSMYCVVLYVRTRLQTAGLDFISSNHADPAPLTAAYLLHKKPAIQAPDDGVMRVYIAMYNVYIECALDIVAQTALHQRL